MDIGKTLSKVTLWSRDGRMIDRQVRANARRLSGEELVLDTAATSEWLMDRLCALAGHPVEYIVPVAHGAAIAGVIDDRAAFESPDYENDLPPDQLEAYRAGRDSFAVSGSPALPGGLNLGAQLHWLESLDSDRFKRATLMPYAQYWAWLLSGQAASEITSLGCHSDLWAPDAGEYSPMAVKRGWSAQFAPRVSAGDVVGTLRPDIAKMTGLSPQVKILAGLHDSNAALLAARGFGEIEGRDVTVLSTGTWFIAMRLTDEPIDLAALPESRDCLVNIDAFGKPVPSARFMGGREIETLVEIDTRQVDIKPEQPKLLAAVPEILTSGAMVLPTLSPGNGPFPNGGGRWVNRPEDWFARRAGACLYAALVADVSLDLIGARDFLLVEGRFAEAQVFVRALATLRPTTKIFVANAHNDVSFGALRLIDPSLRPDGDLRRIRPLDCDLAAYRTQWLDAQRHGT